jgi:hypothetical protein
MIHNDLGVNVETCIFTKSALAAKAGDFFADRTRMEQNSQLQVQSTKSSF